MSSRTADLGGPVPDEQARLKASDARFEPTLLDAALCRDDSELRFTAVGVLKLGPALSLNTVYMLRLQSPL